MKSSAKLLMVVTIAVLVIGAGLLVSRQSAGPAVVVGDTRTLVEVADKPAERELGLGNRDRLAPNQGMLFVFNNEDKHGFWMKNMRFSLDIIWIDANKKIADITPNVVPESYPQVFLPPQPVRYVLEVNSGYASQHSFEIGDQVDLDIN